MNVTDQPANALSSFELFLQGKLQPVETTTVPLRAGSTCPQCGKGKLEYNGVLALECPACGFTGGECGGCT
ncbi:MAG: hypothetical protein ACOYYJ_14615 [Chloroflexota bacterium]